MTFTQRSFLATVLVSLLLPGLGRAERLAVCKSVCSDEVSASCAGLRKHRFMNCRRRLWMRCKKNRLDCSPPTTTTLPPVGRPTPTTLPPVTTTTRPSFTTTSTTFVVPTTTSTTTTLPLVSDYVGFYEFSGQRAVNTCASTYGLPQFFFVTLHVESYFGTNLFGVAYDHPTSFFFANSMQGTATYPHWSMLSAQCELQSIGLVWCASVELVAEGLPAFGQQVPGAMNLHFTFFDGTPDCLMGYGGNLAD